MSSTSLFPSFFHDNISHRLIRIWWGSLAISSWESWILGPWWFFLLNSLFDIVFKDCSPRWLTWCLSDNPLDWPSAIILIGSVIVIVEPWIYNKVSYKSLWHIINWVEDWTIMKLVVHSAKGCLSIFSRRHFF